MQIPISPQEIVNAVVGNNPLAVKENLVKEGLADPLYQVNAAGFSDLLAHLPIQSRSQAIELISRLLDVQIDNNGFAAPWLYQQITTYGQNLRQLAAMIFETHLPDEVGGMTTTKKRPCTCKSPSATAQLQMGALQIILLFLALFGLLSIFALGVKLTLKLFD